jgi:hypothetical protein
MNWDEKRDLADALGTVALTVVKVMKVLGLRLTAQSL